MFDTPFAPRERRREVASTAARPGSRARSPGSRPLGLTRPLSTPAIARGALLAGEERLHDRRGAPCAARPSAYGPAGEQVTTVGRAGREHRVEQRLLRAGQRRGLRRRSPRRSCRGRTGRRGRRGRARRRRRDAASRRGIRDARRSRRRRRWCRARSRSRRRGTRRAAPRAGSAASMPIGDPGMLHADVGRERVAAEHGVRVVGVRADHRDARAARRAAACRRCGAARPPPRRAARRASRFAGGSRSTVPRSDSAVAEVGTGERRRHRRPVGVEQPELGLLAQHAAQRAVDERLVDARRRRPPRTSGCAEGLHRRQLDVDARRRARARGRLAPGRRRRRAAACRNAIAK